MAVIGTRVSREQYCLPLVIKGIHTMELEIRANECRVMFDVIKCHHGKPSSVPWAYFPLSFPARAHPWPLTHPCARPRHSRTPPSVMNIDRFRDRLFTKGRKIEGIVWLPHERARRLRMLHLKTLNTLGKGYSLWEELIYTGNEHEDLNLCWCWGVCIACSK